MCIDAWAPTAALPSGHFVKAIGDVGDRATESEVLLMENDIDARPFSQQVGAGPSIDEKSKESNLLGCLFRFYVYGFTVRPSLLPMCIAVEHEPSSSSRLDCSPRCGAEALELPRSSSPTLPLPSCRCSRAFLPCPGRCRMVTTRLRIARTCAACGWSAWIPSVREEESRGVEE